MYTNDIIIKEISRIRENYVFTLKKLISIQEEIEKSIFYLKNLGDSKVQESVDKTIKYIKDLNKIRDEMTTLMKDNLITIKSFYKDVQDSTLDAQKQTFSLLNEIYSNFVNILIKTYNLFLWIR